MEKYLTSTYLKYVFLLLALGATLVAVNENDSEAISFAMLGASFWLCFSLYVINEKNN